MQKLKKIEEAEKLVLDDQIPKAIKIYNELALSSNTDPFDKIEVLKSLYKTLPDQGRETIIRWRDMLPFIGYKDLPSHKKLLLLACKSPEVDIHERGITATHLYNIGCLDVCYQAFESIAFDANVPLAYRTDACRFLFGSETDENKEIAQECLLEITNDQKIPSKERYSIIAGFISKTGISTYLNQTKIKVPYDESFVYCLQMNFFECKDNDVRDRILSGQHILGMDCASEKEKTDVENEILSIAKDENYDENIRADAADVILRLGNKDMVEKARNIITSLGYSGLGKKEGMLDRIKTIYTNSQNMHDSTIAESVAKVIEMLVENQIVTPKQMTFKDVQEEIAPKLKKYTPEEKHKAKSALHRVSVDTATFTKYNVTVSDILILVWKVIKNQKDTQNKEMLTERLLEELVEMGDTCSSGHSGRFVNVLATLYPSVAISFETQINANIAGRVNARVRNMENKDEKASVTSGMLPDASEEDKDTYSKFIDTALDRIREELYDEFVKEGYLNENEFKMYFENGSKQWLEFKN